MVVGVEVVAVLSVNNYVFGVDFNMQQDPSFPLHVELEVGVRRVFGQEVDMKPYFAESVKRRVNGKNIWHSKDGSLFRLARLLLNHKVSEDAETFVVGPADKAMGGIEGGIIEDSCSRLVLGRGDLSGYGVLQLRG